LKVSGKKKWNEKQIYKVDIDHSKPKYYVLDMFPYPSGAGLHVGHPLGYIATDIYSRYKRMQGFNVLHPMGYDAYGLPAEQYAIQTGQHPAITTNSNIERYREQMDKIGFSYDWSREVRTSDPEYYKWTQWAFIQMFEHWYNKNTDKAEAISTLIEEFEKNGNQNINASCSETEIFSAQDWSKWNEKEQQEILLNYRIAYLADTMVNWCPELGTVLANDEVINGVSERGGHPVVQKKMKQWSLRVSAYAEKLLQGLEKIDWTDSIKEIQKNWIGKSIGGDVIFKVKDSDVEMEIFTTRPDTIYGCTFMVLAPESELVDKLVTPSLRSEVDHYIEETKKKSERERLTEVKSVSGVFTGSYAIHPFTNEEIPVWISDYVLAGYGTGAIMAVPAHDSRDFSFARHFELPIIQVVCKKDEKPSDTDTWEESYDSKEGYLINSELINNLDVPDAIDKIIAEMGKLNIGEKKTNYRLRDAIFSRQRYWGEPFPIYYKDGVPYPLTDDDLPLELPEVDKYLPTEKGEPPLGRAQNWKTKDGYPLELNTMPGFAGSSAYYTRYMDPKNNNALVSKEANEYWRNVDLYIGGTEHATGHLIYSRFWNHFLFDIGAVCEKEPFKKMINQGMIQGRSNFVYRVNTRKYCHDMIWGEIKDNNFGFKFSKDKGINNEIYSYYCEEKNVVIELKGHTYLEEYYNKHERNVRSIGAKLLLLSNEEIVLNKEAALNKIKKALNGEDFEAFNKKNISPFSLFISKTLVKESYEATPIHIDVNIVENDIVDVDKLRKWRPEFENAHFILEENKLVCGHAVEKMSKRYYNVVNPDDIVEKYGADTLRMYEMFLGPIEISKPWDMNGIEGVHKFLKKLWRLFYKQENFVVSDENPTNDELKSLHKAIKKVSEDIERFSFNTSISAFMICVNELSDLKCNKKQILQPFIQLLAPFAPHVCDELWNKLGNETSIHLSDFPKFEQKFLVENSFKYPVSFNGKTRFLLELPADMSKDEVEAAVLANENSQKWLDGKTPKKVIVVPKRIINIVV
jgi:leucyl-tRNA synthetase